VLSLAPGTAHAQGDDMAAAEALFNEARALFDDGKIGEAFLPG
jgi:hypothetical protein